MTPSQIRALRRKLKLSREKFGAGLGFADKSAPITVWRWETGRRKPSAQTLMVMSRLLEATPVVVANLPLRACALWPECRLPMTGLLTCRSRG
jgi:DNA-binding transcriptional regulator YiaG